MFVLPESSSIKHVMQAILAGRYRIILISPEILLTQDFLLRVLNNDAFRRQIYSVDIDEAHCISVWGADFRKKYAQIGVTRCFLPRGTPMMALSATLTATALADVKRTLQFDDTAQFINNGSQRDDISIVVRAMHHTAESHRDLDFIPALRKKTWVYCDGISEGLDIANHLRSLLPSASHGRVRIFNAVLSANARAKILELFVAGEIDILVCTDAAGMVRDVNPTWISSLTGYLSRAATFRTSKWSFNGNSPLNSLP